MICIPSRYLIIFGMLLGIMFSWSVFSLALCELMIKKAVEMATKDELKKSAQRLADYKKKLKERLAAEKARIRPIPSKPER